MQWAQGQQQSAIESFRAAIEATPGWGEAHVALGNTLLATGDQTGATVHSGDAASFLGLYRSKAQPSRPGLAPVYN
jgi:Flp pilus assembly protein TadD